MVHTQCAQTTSPAFFLGYSDMMKQVRGWFTHRTKRDRIVNFVTHKLAKRERESHRHQMEQLESRVLLSSSLFGDAPTTSLVDGVLTVYATDRAESIVIQQQEEPGNVTIGISAIARDFGRGENLYETFEGVKNVVLFAGDGDDIITVDTANRGANGAIATEIDAGTGNDYVLGGDGDDRILGGTGFDSINGGAGNDWLDGQADSDTIIAGPGVDTLLGGSGSDNLTGNEGVNRFDGGEDDDLLQSTDWDRDTREASKDGDFDLFGSPGVAPMPDVPVDPSYSNPILPFTDPDDLKPAPHIDLRTHHPDGRPKISEKLREILDRAQAVVDANPLLYENPESLLLEVTNITRPDNRLDPVIYTSDNRLNRDIYTADDRLIPDIYTADNRLNPDVVFPAEESVTDVILPYVTGADDIFFLGDLGLGNDTGTFFGTTGVDTFTGSASLGQVVTSTNLFLYIDGFNSLTDSLTFKKNGGSDIINGSATNYTLTVVA